MIRSVLLNWSQVRYRRAVAFREYRQPHFKQKLLLAVCEPVFPRSTIPLEEKCGHLRPPPPRSDHPYDILLAADMAQELKQSKLLCLFHQNQFSRSDRKLLSNEFEHEGMLLRYYNRDIARICLQNTPYQLLLHFAIGYPFTVLFAPNLEKIDKIFKISRKYPQAILMCALVEHRRLITNDQLQELAKLGDIDQQRAILCNTLMIGQQQMISTLTHHTSQLKQLINSRHQELEKNDQHSQNR